MKYYNNESVSVHHEKLYKFIWYTANVIKPNKYSCNMHSDKKKQEKIHVEYKKRYTNKLLQSIVM